MFFRIFLKDISELLRLDQDNYHYLVKVLKLSVGDFFEVVQGSELIKVFKISKIEKKYLEAVLESKYLENNESEIKLSLAQALLKPEKIELILQKCTEIGVKEFLIFCADKSPIRLKNVTSKISRWEKIIEGAVCQSRRNYKPEVKIFSSLKELFQDQKNIFYHADFSSKKTLEDIKVSGFTIVIGPESGFSEKEKRLMQEKSEAVSLGKRTLRTETAAIAVCSKILL